MASTETTDLSSERLDGSRLTRFRVGGLRVHQFRWVAGTSLTFSADKVVLLGQNGVGKTTLLQLVVACITGRLDRFAREELDIEYDLHFGDLCVHLRLCNQHKAPDEALAGHTPKTFRAQLHLSAVRVGGHTRHVRQTISIDPAHPLPLFELLHQTVRDEPALRASERIGNALSHVLNGLAHTRRLDESLAFFEALGQVEFTIEQYAGSVVRESVVPELPSSIMRQLSRQISEWSDEVHKAAPMSLTIGSQSNVPLTVVKRLVAVDDVDMTMQLVRQDGVSWHFGRLALRFQRGEHLWHHDALSFGEKRLVAAVLYAFNMSDWFIADELVNGMHYDWIRECLDLIGDKQAFLASQNPLLLDHLTFESVEQVKNTFIRCTLEGDDEKRWVWRNFTDDEAREFFEAYEAGFQHVGEILRVHGLW